MWQTLFEITNGVALIGWALLILAPRYEIVLRSVLYAAIGLLAAIYIVMLVGLTGGWLDSMPAPGAQAGLPDEYTVAGLMEAFRSEGAVVIAWTHFLAFDLFAGLWVARDADKRGFNRLLQVPFLLATFLAGPLGLLGWLLARLASKERSDADG